MTFQSRVIAIGAVILVAAFVYRCVEEAANIAGGPCVIDRIYGGYSAPNSERMAVVYVPGCGATVGFYTQVAIAQRSDSFVINRDPVVFSVKGLVPIIPKWIDNNTLEIPVPKDAEIGRQDASADGVKIVYR